MLLKLFLVCSFLCSFTTALTTWQVSSNCAGVSNCFNNVTGAVFHAGPNDLINIDAGEWPIFQSVNLYGKPLSIVGAGSGSTVVNCTGGTEWDFYYSPYYVQGITFVACNELYVEQASLSLQDVVISGAEYGIGAEYATIKMRSTTIQSQYEYSYIYYSDLEWLDDAVFDNILGNDYALYLYYSTMKVAGDLTISCAPINSVSSGFEAVYWYAGAINIGGDFVFQSCPGTALYGGYGEVLIGGDWINTNITCTTDGYVEYAQIIVNGNYQASNSQATDSCVLVELYSAGWEVFGDFTVQNIKYSGTSSLDGFIYLEDYSSLIIHGNTLFNELSYDGDGGVAGMEMYYSYLQTMGTFTMSNVFYNNTGGGTITRATTTVDSALYIYESTWEAKGAVLIDNVGGASSYLLDIEYTNLVTYGTFTVSNCKNYYLYEYLIYYYYGSWTAYDVVTIANNVGGEYGALYIEEGGSFSFAESFILSNNTGYYSGGGYWEYCGMTFSGPFIVSGNKATYSDGYPGGVYLYEVGMTTLSSATINNNYGGGMVFEYSGWIAEGDVTMSGNVNPWDENPGGAMYIYYESSWVTYGNTVLSNNKANSTGGAVAFYYESVWRSVGAVTITNNQANQAGGGVWIEDGEESMWASQGPVTISGNSAPLGGGVYVGSGTSWANSFYDPSFSSNSASDGGSDIFCNAGYLFSLSKSCNSSTVACVPGCQFGLIDIFLSLSATSLTFNNTFSGQSVTASLSSALPVALNVGYSLTLSTPSLANQVVINPAGSIPFPAGTTSVTITVALNSSLAQTNQWVTVQGSVQLLPPTPELLVFLGTDSSLALGINIAPSSSDSVRMMSSWLILFSHLFESISVL